MPPSREPSFLVRRASDGPNLTLIFVAIVGGIIVLALLIGVLLLPLLRRRKQSTQQSASRLGHKHTASDASATSLLYPRPLWTATGDGYPINDYPRSSFDHMQERNGSTDSLDTVKPTHNEKFCVPSADTDTTPFISEPHPSKRDLPPLTIPSTLPHVPSLPIPVTSPYEDDSRPSSAASDSSDSLYSQASAPSHISSFPMPPMTPQYTHLYETGVVPARSDTVVVGKLLKERAKRNPNKIGRSVSRIERVGSIKAADDSDQDDDAEQPQPRPVRPRRSKSKRRALVPMGSLAEGSESGSPPSSSRGVPALPPPTLLATSWANNETSPPPRPLSLLPPRTSSRPENLTLHMYSRSLDGHVQVGEGGTPEGLHAHRGGGERGVPRAHVRQYSAERALDVTHPAGRKVSTHGLIGG
ncbi:hypothetical protein FPV67DRAFT_1455183 [Lyophyllum atratum]|nr:hypothetical protein FPV67DRAFT_1455183 [Lyophyllum atratum]